MTVVLDRCDAINMANSDAIANGPDTIEPSVADIGTIYP